MPKALYTLILYYMFKFTESPEVMRQQGDHDFISLLNKILIGDIYETAQKQLEQRFIQQLLDNYPVKMARLFNIKLGFMA